MAFASEDDGPIALDWLPDWERRFSNAPASPPPVAGQSPAPPAAAFRLSFEVGPGHGGFAVAFAKRHPDRAIVVIEQRKAFAKEVAEKAAQQKLENLLSLHGDARLMAPRLFAAGSLASVHVHFPDPWWKRKHHRRRIVDDGMSRLLLSLLAPGAPLDFRTDVERYALDALETFEDVGFENEAGAGQFAERLETDIPSTREHRYLQTGQRVWRLKLRRAMG